MNRTLTIGTRRSLLAVRQTELVAAGLEAAFPGIALRIERIVTEGDRSQGKDVPLPPSGLKGLWTAELEEGLARGTLDLAVHSLKDMPVVIAPEFVIGAVPRREDVRDILVTRNGGPLRELPTGARIGTSSVRRGAQLRKVRPDLRVDVVRGNIDTRIRRATEPDGGFDAVILAYAGLRRLGIEKNVAEIFDEEVVLPAPAQGALAIQCRTDDVELLTILGKITDDDAVVETTAERAFVHALGASCQTPLAALARRRADGRVDFIGRCFSQDGERMIEVRGSDDSERAAALGRRMGEEAIASGYHEL